MVERDLAAAFFFFLFDGCFSSLFLEVNEQTCIYKYASDLQLSFQLELWRWLRQ